RAVFRQAPGEVAVIPTTRHGRACPGHPRLRCAHKEKRKTWMPRWLAAPRHDAPGSNVQSAPPPAFCAIACGSMVQTRCDRLSSTEPAAPSGGTPASAIVASSSCALCPVRSTDVAPKVSLHERAVMSTLLARQTTASALTEILLPGGNATWE